MIGGERHHEKNHQNQKTPIKLWIDDIEPGALAQARNLANLLFVFHHVAIMPNAHQDYGMPIGGVLVASGFIIPNAIGVDICCGMCAVPTSLTAIDREDLKNHGLDQKNVGLDKALDRRRRPG